MATLPAAPGPIEILDVTGRSAVEAVLRRRRVDTIYHLAAVLSAVGETDPQRA